MGLKIGERYKGSVYNVTRITEHFVELEDTGMVSAYDKGRYECIPGLAEKRTAQTVFGSTFLKGEGLPLAFMQGVNKTTIVCRYGDMMRGEWVTRSRLIGSYRERHPAVVEGTRVKNNGVVNELFSKLALDMSDPQNPQLVDGNSVRKGPGIYMDPYLLTDTKDGRWEVYDAHAEVKPGKNHLYRIEPLLDAVTLAQRWDVAKEAYRTMKRGLEAVDYKALGEPGLGGLEMVDWKIEFTTDGLIGDVVNLDCMRLLKNGQLGKENQISKQVFRDGGSHADVLKVYDLGLRIFEQLAA